VAFRADFGVDQRSSCTTKVGGDASASASRPHLCHTKEAPCMEHRRPRDALSCDRCRAKKLKCSKDAPICTSCAHSGSHCHYSGKVARSPLTRAYLTGVEKRLHGLESLVTQLLPGVDIEDLLSAPNVADSARSVIIQSQTPEVAPSPQGSTNSSTHEPALPEAVPNNVDGFNWQEEDVNVDGLTDGMAALSVEPTGVGYLGQLLPRSIQTTAHVTETM
jgi:transcriptional regulatory protein GAL4